MLKKELVKQTSRAEQCTQLKNQLEKQNFEFQQVTSKLKELEYERDSYKDWQTQSKVNVSNLPVIISKSVMSNHSHFDYD